MAAEVHISTWAELVSAVRNATEVTNVYIDNDIDLNNEYPEGIPTSCALSSSATWSVYIYAQNHKINNLLMDSNIAVFAGRIENNTNYVVDIYDCIFENLQIQPSGSTGKFLGDGARIIRCTISMTVFGRNSSTELFATTGTQISRCAVTITGSQLGNAVNTVSFNSSKWYNDFNNIKLLGTFKRIVLTDVRNSYISGDFEQTGTSSSDFSLKLAACVINAKIKMAVMPSITNTLITLINIDELTFPSGKTADNLSSMLTKVSTADLQSVSTLRELGFPIRSGG